MQMPCSASPVGSCSELAQAAGHMGLLHMTVEHHVSLGMAAAAAAGVVAAAVPETDRREDD